MIDAALAKGANEVSGIEFTSSRADSARRAAIAKPSRTLVPTLK